MRRVSLDLTGLPPTLAEIDAFLNDRSPNAYEKVVDRLLASPRYGERMAFRWLDAARYADTNGYQLDGERQMWRWRDWVIDAFNRNMPFDQFTIEQLAGDLLPNATLDQKIATGFNRNHRTNAEGGIVPEEYRVEYVVDRVDTTSTVFLGLTMGARAVTITSTIRSRRRSSISSPLISTTFPRWPREHSGIAPPVFSPQLAIKTAASGETARRGYCTTQKERQHRWPACSITAQMGKIAHTRITVVPSDALLFRSPFDPGASLKIREGLREKSAVKAAHGRVNDTKTDLIRAKTRRVSRSGFKWQPPHIRSVSHRTGGRIRRQSLF